jgi:hypothetical protein
MSLIIHRCECSHPDYYHRGDLCSHGQCKCPRLRLDPQSEVIPTWSTETSELVESITEPGTKWNAGRGANAADMCGCEACRALYNSLGGAA